MGRNSHKNMSAPAKHPAYLAERGDIVVKVFDNIEGRDQVKRLVSEREILGRPKTNIGQAALVTVPNRLLIDVDALGRSVRGEVSQHGPGPATNVEDLALLCRAPTYVSIQDL